jgi:excisionase family DNA binding protein
MVETVIAETPDGKPGEWDDDRLGDAHDVAAILNVPVTWVQQAGADGRLKSLKVGAYRRYRKADVLAFIEGRS